MNPAIALAVQAFAGAAGEKMSEMDKYQQRRLIEKMMAEFDGVSLPDIQRILAEELGPQAMEGVFADDELAGLEREALDEMLRVGRSGGLTLEDKAALNTIGNKTARQNRAANDAVREQMAARGQSGGGAELAMKLANNQAAAQRRSEEDMHLAGVAQRRGFDAMLAGGRMAGGMRERDFSEKARRAEAADKRAQYNAAARERAGMYNANAPQQQFQNQMARAAGKTGQMGKGADYYGQQAADTRQLYAGMGKAAYEAFADEDEEG